MIISGYSEQPITYKKAESRSCMIQPQSTSGSIDRTYWRFTARDVALNLINESMST